MIQNTIADFLRWMVSSERVAWGRNADVYRLLDGEFQDCLIRLRQGAIDRGPRQTFRGFLATLQSTTCLNPVNMGFAGHHVGQVLVEDDTHRMRFVLKQEKEALSDRLKRYTKENILGGYERLLDDLNNLPHDGIRSLFASIMRATELNIGVDFIGEGNLFISDDALSIIDLPIDHLHTNETFAPHIYTN
jgi:hypothetical protein